VSGFRYGSLVLLTSLLGATKDPLRILDFGGALGIAYAQILRSACLPPHFEFHVVDNRESCMKGRKLVSADPRISFHESLDESVGNIDIVFLSGVLQYIRDYKGTLKVLAGLRPSFILMTYISAGNIPTFASSQVNLMGSVLPAWFFSVQEITDLMNVLVYRVLLKLSVDPEDRIDTSNLPPGRRLTHMADLLFSPKTSSQV
jgi:putative methyltransferase (TIGR04325 family)